MLSKPPFEGTIKVRNKGVEVAILADEKSVDTSFMATRILSVCGISTALLEVTCLDPVDEKTLEYYEDTVEFFMIMGQELQKALKDHFHKDTRIYEFSGENASALAEEIRKVR